jgi:hypothetical protein
MRRRLLPLILLLPMLAWAAESADSDFHWKGRLAPEKLVAVKTINGAIEVTGVDGDEIEVTATKSGPHADKLNVQALNTDDGILVCETYRYEDDSSDTCGQGGSHSHSHGSTPQVNYTVRLPRNLRLAASTVNGSVSARSLGRYAEVSSVNGSVEVSTAKWAKASSVNGSIRAQFGEAGWDTLKLTTVNGGIHVALPSNVNTDVHFSSVNGHLDSDFPITTQGRLGRHSFEGKIGSGGRDLELTTVNGSVELQKSTM